MDRKFERVAILDERVLSPEAALWIDRTRKVVLRTGATGFLKGGLLRDYVYNLYNGTNLTPEDLDIMFLGGVNFVVSELVKEGAIIQSRRNRRKTPVFELGFPTSLGTIKTDIGIVLGNPSTYERGQKIENFIEDDAKLSDFTVNSLFLPLEKTLDISNIIDPLCGIKDILNQQIRMVSPNTFVRNPECMLRAVRVAERLSAIIEPFTFQAIKHYAPLILKAPQFVIKQNLEAILTSPNKKHNIEILESLSLLQYLPTK